MTILVTLKENLICPDGEEYRAIWGELDSEVANAGQIKVGKTVLHLDSIVGSVYCERPKVSTQTVQSTKDGPVFSESKEEDVKHIYYSE